MQFDTIEYLKSGTERQRQAYALLTRYRILLLLEVYDPLLVGTIPINIDIESSDLDIICCFRDKEVFRAALVHVFSAQKNFTMYENDSKHAVVATFNIENFTVEIFGQATPTREQTAYRHMIIEHTILLEQGENFRQQIINLKRKGYKTEPAFGILLGLNEDPYQQLLMYRTKQD